MSQRGKIRERERAIEALLSCPTIEKAAKQAGISKCTLLRWLQQADFRDAYMKSKADVLRTATATLTRNAGRAASVLREIFEDAPTPHQGGRATAAIATIRLSLDAFELENLEERIRKLEAQDGEL